MANIKNVFVLMLENRSFDHLLGFSGLPGVNPPPALVPGAVDQLANDPPHEFDDVAAQVDGGAMDGFERSGGPDTMMGFGESEVPKLIDIAANNLYFDNWFSSMPGPTWPNRLFAHAASSGGLANSLSGPDAIKAVKNPGFFLDFSNGHIFDRLTRFGVTWRVYHHKALTNFDYPQVLCLKGMVDKWHNNKFFRPFSQLASDIKAGDVAAYTFIEPKYDLPGYSQGNSQHPIGRISDGDFLIQSVYDKIFKQKVGANSALLITWDEHGGFYDNVNPPAAAPPGDAALNKDRAQIPRDFPFDRFGVRVPAVLVSPWLKSGLGSDIFGNGSHFDHSSIIRALRTTFSLGGQLTNRDEASPDWNAALLTKPRVLKLKSHKGPKPKLAGPPPSLKKVAAKGDPSGNLLGVAQIAVDIDWYAAERLSLPPHIASDFEERMQHAQVVLARPRETVAPAQRTAAHLTILQYIAAVQARDTRLQAIEQKAVGKSAAAKSRPKAKAKKLKKSVVKKQAAKRSRPKRAK